MIYATMKQRKERDMENTTVNTNTDKKSSIILIIKMLFTVGLGIASVFIGFLCFILSFMVSNLSAIILSVAGIFILPSVLPFIWLKKRKKYFIGWLCCVLAVCIAFVIPFSIEKYQESITIDVTPNINVNEYLPFSEDSKIVKLDSKTLKLTEDLPIIDGATAAFPVYSAFVNAVYPDTTTLRDGVFEYNNTVGGYRKLAERRTDIFLGAAPSKEQTEYAVQCGTTFKYTQIGTEAFVFFVHKDNPIESLTVEQLQGIYSGDITNWSEVGGADEEIVAFQRNEGSGSQSMLIRFMGDTPIMEPKTREIKSMGGIIEQVVDYLKDQIKRQHVIRVQKNLCTIEHGFILSDILTDLERVSDHCSNIAGCLIEMSLHDTLDLHNYLHNVKANSEEFNENYKAFMQKYSISE